MVLNEYPFLYQAIYSLADFADFAETKISVHLHYLRETVYKKQV